MVDAAVTEGVEAAVLLAVGAAVPVGDEVAVLLHVDDGDADDEDVKDAVADVVDAADVERVAAAEPLAVWAAVPEVVEAAVLLAEIVAEGDADGKMGARARPCHSVLPHDWAMPTALCAFVSNDTI